MQYNGVQFQYFNSDQIGSIAKVVLKYQIS